MEKKRNDKIDNIKFLLIFCVVFGHLLELYPDSNPAMLLYRIIYSFHMPAFLFVSGYFARQGRTKLIRQMLVLYVIFQTLYLLFQHAIAEDGSELALQYTTPNWVLWYLVLLVYYYLLLPLVETDKPKTMGIIAAGAFVLAVLVGFDSSVSYFMALSRFFVFLPFFLLGLYASKLAGTEKGTALLSRRRLWTVLCGAGALLGAAYIRWAQVPVNALYGTCGYEVNGTTPLMRVIWFAVALCWIGLLFCLVPGRKIPGVTVIGRNTLPVFLLHGFLVKGIVFRYLGPLSVFQYAGLETLVLTAVLALAILLLLGNPVADKAFKKVFLW